MHSSTVVIYIPANDRFQLRSDGLYHHLENELYTRSLVSDLQYYTYREDYPDSARMLKEIICGLATYSECFIRDIK